jgi:hypothetical protein
MTKKVRTGEAAPSAEHDEALLLALLNTTPTVNGQQLDELADKSSSRAWLSANLLGDTDLDLLRETRTALQQVVLGEIGPSAVARALDGVQLTPEIGDDGIAWVRHTPTTTAAAARAVLAWDRMRESLPGRIRLCANPQCTLFFVDRSRNNGARWCSMATCGNRMKARRHYVRSNSGGAGE